MGVFYLTTPIYYPNAPPHLGHAYTTVFADILARYRRLVGDDVFLLTGTDEHGLKLQRAAEKAGVHPKELVDKMAEVYKGYWRMLGIESGFIRTTDPDHEAVVRHALETMRRKELLYKDRYAGWYCVDCEKFYGWGEYEVVDGKPRCPIHKKPLEYLEEDTYYFALSRFEEHLKKVLSSGVVYPEQYAREILSKIESSGLRDVSVARPRSRVWWGIRVPWDPDYTVYVWFDALLNYLSGIGYTRDWERFEKYWGAAHHVIGKDILWFHTVIWFSMLEALDLPPPKRLIVHAFLVNRGLKMGKSSGNVVAIEDMMERYGGSDGVRYLIARVFNLSRDVEVSTRLLDSLYNTELADTLGNLVRRVGVLAQRRLGGVVDSGSVDGELEKAMGQSLERYREAFDKYDVSRAVQSAMDLLREANAYVNRARPWEKSSPRDELYTLLEAVKLASRMLSPVIPETARRIAESLGFELASPYSERLGAQSTYKVLSAPVLFRKVGR